MEIIKKMMLENITLNETLWTINTLKNETSFSFNNQAVLECRNLCAESLSGLSNNKDLVLPCLITIFALMFYLYVNIFHVEKYERDNLLILISVFMLLLNIAYLLKFLNVF